jgi:hypothetical protein
METQCIFSEVWTEFIYVIWILFIPEGVNTPFQLLWTFYNNLYIASCFLQKYATK